jgi:hypothetical protein
MRQVNPNLSPKSGYFFKDKDGARIVANSWAGVIVRVQAYRKRAGYPPGDPAGEVMTQACAREPVICTDEGTMHQNALKKASLKSRVLGWMGLARKHRAEQKLNYVDAATAAARAEVCARCPQNTPLPTGCASCTSALQEMRNEVLGRRNLDKRLNACLVLGEDMQTAAHLERETADIAELPAHCWRKRTLS